MTGRPKRHPYHGTKLYNIWSMMKQRCNNQNHFAYKWYGARGISVCKEWNDDVVNFCEWSLSNGYEEGLVLDRIDNNKNYTPDNCQWITHKENTAIGKRRSLKNTSGFNGVWYDKTKGKCKWRADIVVDGRKIGLGSYKTFEEAVNARINAEIEHFGERKTYM